MVTREGIFMKEGIGVRVGRIATSYSKEWYVRGRNDLSNNLIVFGLCLSYLLIVRIKVDESFRGARGTAGAVAHKVTGGALNKLRHVVREA